MEIDEDTESVTEAKTMSVKKKVDVLEAMAKYNLKKQQERELSMKSTVKPKEETGAEKPDIKNSQFKKSGEKQQEYHYSKRKDFGGRKKDFGNQQKRNFPTEKQPFPTQGVYTQQVDTQKESKIGITEFVYKGVGFSAILKQRYSDFHVHEISMDGKVVHLTDQSIPTCKESNSEGPLSEEELSVLTDDQWKCIEEMMKSEESKTVEIDVTEKSKEERQNMHKVLRRKFEGIVSNSTPIDGKTIMKVLKSTGRRQASHEKRRLGPAYTQFVLYKENLSTMEAISLIARKTRMKAALFMTAGTKDKRGITSQLVTVKNVDPKKLLNSVRNEGRVAVGNFSFSEKPLELGHLKGNRFIIALRNVVGDESAIQANLESLKENGFINYYGAQRFGTRHVPTHYIGKKLLLQQWQEAVDLILEPPEVTGKFQREYDLLKARVEYRKSRDTFKACELINRSQHTIEAQLLLNLKKFGKDLVGALNTIPRNLRLTYIHAYQSFLWNTVVSKRLAKFGLTPIVGDLVYASPGSDEEDIEADTEIVNDESQLKEPENERSTEKEGDGGDCKSRAQRNQRKVIAIDESNMQNYTINDVLLPLPGFDITYPSNEVAGWYTELLEADGLSELDFKQSVKTYNLGGAYRLVMSKPQDVKWKFVRYDDPSLALIPSDWDRLENTQSPPAVVEGGAFLGLILEFNLPLSAYATMALREITKMDMSAEFQTSLNEAGTCKQPTMTGSGPDSGPGPVPVQDPPTDEPEMKRMKQEEPVESQEV